MLQKTTLPLFTTTLLLSTLVTASHTANAATVIRADNLGAKLINPHNLGPVRMVDGGQIHLPSPMSLTPDQSTIATEMHFRVECPSDFNVGLTHVNVRGGNQGLGLPRTDITTGGKRLYSSLTATPGVATTRTIREKCRTVLNQGVTNSYNLNLEVRTLTNCREDKVLNLDGDIDFKTYDRTDEITLTVICEDLEGINTPYTSSTGITPAFTYSCPQVPKSLNHTYWENHRLVVKGTPYRQITVMNELKAPECIRINSGMDTDSLLDKVISHSD